MTINHRNNRVFRNNKLHVQARNCLSCLSSSYSLVITYRICIFVTGEEGEETEVESPKIYEPIGSFKELSDRLEMHQQQYNESIRGAKMDLVFFKVTVCIFDVLFTYYKSFVFVSCIVWLHFDHSVTTIIN